MKSLQLKPLFFFSLFLFSFAARSASRKVEEGVFVLDPKHNLLLEISNHREWTIDHVSSAGFEVYGPRGFSVELNRMNVSYLNMETLDGDMSIKALDYPNYTQVVARLKQIESKCSNIMKLVSIGKSGQGRDLWVMKVSNNPSVDQAKPEVKYISSMHGDEITGRELMQNLLDDICSNYGHDSAITQFVDQFEIFILPSMNPDGSERHTRANAAGYDLNRDFPDFSSDNHNTPQGRQIETQAVMKFQAERNFVLSANFHGGAEVVNYPWDTVKERHPADPLFKDLSLVYASRVPYIANSGEFQDGITNGYDWYEVDGGMQDWSDHWYHDMQITIELSGDKWPEYSQIPHYWNENRSALYAYFMMAAQGAGFSFNSSETGTVDIVRLGARGEDEKVIGSFSFAHGEFYRVLEVGKYRFDVKVANRPAQPEPMVFDVKKVTPNFKIQYKKLN